MNREKTQPVLKLSIAVGMPVTRHPLHRSGREALPHPAPTLGNDGKHAVDHRGVPTARLPYMRQRLGHARPALRPVRVTCRLFPLVTALPSTHSAAHRDALFAGFFGTMLVSDGSGPCITGVERDSSRCGPPYSGWPALSSPGSRARSVHACWGSQTAQSPRSTRGGVLLGIAFRSPTSVGALD
jgi:hypothetical protein